MGPAFEGVSTVWLWPPTRASDSKTVTSCRWLSSQAADSPEIPVPTTAMFNRSLDGEDVQASTNIATPKAIAALGARPCFSSLYGAKGFWVQNFF
jgi:hypothetical protein